MCCVPVYANRRRCDTRRDASRVELTNGISPDIDILMEEQFTSYPMVEFDVKRLRRINCGVNLVYVCVCACVSMRVCTLLLFCRCSL